MDNRMDDVTFKQWHNVCIVLADKLVPEGGLEVCMAHSSVLLSDGSVKSRIYWRAEVRTFNKGDFKTSTIVYIADATTEYEAGVILLSKLLEDAATKGIKLPNVLKMSLEKVAALTGINISSFVDKKSNELPAIATGIKKIPSNLN